MPQNPVVRLIVAVALLLAVVAGLMLYTPLGRQLWTGTRDGDGSAALIGGPFHLTDQYGHARTDADFRGQYLLVFFGYTNCPDVCPTTLQAITGALDKLGADAHKVTVLFITIDPDRDTAAVLKAYAANFTPRLIALTGTPEEIAGAAKVYRIYYKKAGEGADYSMDHSAIVYVMGPDGSYLAHYPPNVTADDILKDLQQRL